MDSKVAAELGLGKDSQVTCKASHGLEVRATLLRFTRFLAVFEIYAPSVILRMSEVLDDFRIVVNGRPVYSGRAVVNNLVNAGEILICEATLDDHWIDAPDASRSGETRL